MIAKKDFRNNVLRNEITFNIPKLRASCLNWQFNPHLYIRNNIVLTNTRDVFLYCIRLDSRV